jgi:hypothetical protein
LAQSNVYAKPGNFDKQIVRVACITLATSYECPSLTPGTFARTISSSFSSDG